MLFFFSKKGRKYIFQVNRTLNSSFVGEKKKSDYTLQQHSVRLFFFLWEMGSFTGCTDRLSKQSIHIKGIYSTLKQNTELYHFTSSSNIENRMDLV